MKGSTKRRWLRRSRVARNFSVAVVYLSLIVWGGSLTKRLFADGSSAAAEGRSAERRQAGKPPGEWEPAPTTQPGQGYPDLNALKALGSSAVATAAPAEAPEKPRLLFVDVGPPRSEVYLGGRLLGKTPYAGQVSCRSGDAVQLTVVPPRGMPLTVVGVCRGSEVHAIHE